MAAEYNFLTWNIRGIATPIKRHRVYSSLRRIHFACLQETHMIATELAKVGKRWRGQVYGTCYSAFARGVLVSVAPGVPFMKTRVPLDLEGRFVFLEGELDGKAINIAAVYAPNVGQREFLGARSPACFSFLGVPGMWGVTLTVCS